MELSFRSFGTALSSPLLHCPTCGQEVSPLAANCPYDGTELDPNGLGFTVVRPSLDVQRIGHGRESAQDATAIDVTGQNYSGITQTELQRLEDLTETGMVHPARSMDSFDTVPGIPLPENLKPASTEDLPASDSTDSHDPLVGAEIGEYLIELRVGSGPNGVVYKARQTLTGQAVAIKVLRPERVSDVAQTRFLGEARTISALRHPKIVQISGFGRFGNQNYRVMEYLEGRGLEVLLTEVSPLPIGEALRVADDVLEALDAVHAAGVVHRNLKPSNVFLAAGEDRLGQVKLLDFAMATPVAADGREAKADRAYRPPEFMPREPLTPQADLYSVGAILFEMLTGRPPIEGVALAALNPVIPPRVDQFVSWLLDKDPAQRPANAREAREQLALLRRSVADTPVRTSETMLPPVIVSQSAYSAPERPRDTDSSITVQGTSRRTNLLLVSGSAVAVTALGLLLSGVWRNAEPPEQPALKAISPASVRPTMEISVVAEPGPPVRLNDVPSAREFAEAKKRLEQRLDAIDRKRRTGREAKPGMEETMLRLRSELKRLPVDDLQDFTERVENVERGL